MTGDEAPGRVCREVQAHLPALVDGTLPRWRRRLVERHLRRCEGCAAELQRQQAVDAGLEELEEVVTTTPAAPPEGLLETLLEQAEKPGIRGRAAVPARGAVSGARPGLSVALLVIGAVIGTAAGYAGWRSARTVRRLLDRD